MEYRERLLWENNIMLRALCAKNGIDLYKLKSVQPRIKGAELMDKIEDLTNKGYSKIQIAQMLSVSLSTVSKYRKQLNAIKAKANNEYEIGSDEDQAALDAMLDFPLEFDDDEID